ncbi:MAG TPA: hypothetical protein VIL24_04100 [Clostridia bacterium]
MEFSKKINNVIDKIPIWAGFIMLGVAITFSSLYASQDALMLFFMISWGRTGAMSETFGWWFYIFGGLINLAIFELAMRIVVYFLRLQMPIINKNAAYHCTRVVFSINYLILGFLHLVYFFFPLLQVWGALADFIISALFLYLDYYLISRKQLPNFLWSRALRTVATIFFLYHGISAALAAFGGVL